MHISVPLLGKIYMLASFTQPALYVLILGWGEILTAIGIGLGQAYSLSWLP
jgi:hypothetical protein